MRKIKMFPGNIIGPKMCFILTLFLAIPVVVSGPARAIKKHTPGDSTILGAKVTPVRKGALDFLCLLSGRFDLF
jgi:hypothetical protein